MKEREVWQEELEALRSELAEARDALEAIRTGGVDALVIYTPEGEQVFTLQSAEHPYRVMVETINEGAASLSEGGVVLWANTWLANMLETQLSALQGSSMLDWVAPKDHHRFEAIFDQGHQEKCKTELDFYTSQGQLIPVLLSLSPVLVSGMIYVCLIATDLTDQKQRAQVAAAEREAKAIIDQAGEAIVVCDTQGKVTRASQAAYRLAEKNPLFQAFETVFPLCYKPAADPLSGSILSQALAGRSFQGLEASLECYQPENGMTKTFSLLVNVTPLIVPGEGQMGAVITMTDITERIASEAAIRKYTQRLERSNRDLQDFAFIASHDMQEPLRKVESFGELLLSQYQDRLDETGKDYIVRMQAAAARMKKMINDLLAYSRIATKAAPFSDVDLNQVTRAVLNDLENRILRSQAKVTLGDLPVIQADPMQMNQLIQNLISNALKFHAHGVKPEIRVEAAKTGDDKIELSVTDNGIGFDVRFLERIFQPFQRLHGRNEYDGNGIGLALCRKIVERHHGQITARSTPGHGATFLVTLPVKPPQD